MKVLRFDMASRRISDLESAAVAAHRDADEDQLFLVDGTAIKEQGAGTLQAGLWRGRRHSFAWAQPLGWGRLSGRLEAGATLRLVVDGVEVFETLVEDNEPFRLPDEAIGRHWELELESTDRVTGIKLAQASEELAT